ncbi:protein kinase domain protein [Aspergillus terreus]|uniref:Protein kinase domain protein n=1 Tax=Aspergillus terreus TaxID=33178 RepID=A0A5M3YZI7_ASPTE|nr:hypothetical protein ATETN484_0004061300 [Aspergillus terreus]GFF13502.1 protein kinase domain protein [Aspergillus terreus]
MSLLKSALPMRLPTKQKSFKHLPSSTPHLGKPLPPNTPATAVLPLSLGEAVEEFTLTDARVLLSDFGESFNPTDNPRRGKDCHTPLAARPPEVLFQSQTYRGDPWYEG